MRLGRGNTFGQPPDIQVVTVGKLGERRRQPQPHGCLAQLFLVLFRNVWQGIGHDCSGKGQRTQIPRGSVPYFCRHGEPGLCERGTEESVPSRRPGSGILETRVNKHGRKQEQSDQMQGVVSKDA
eukprot:scaffold2989_cov184-Amphora_coffeaeformis.AAC.8